MAGPSLPDVGILALVPEPFFVPWMSRHQIMTRLSGYFPCVWINPARHWREVLRAPLGAERRDGASSVAPPTGLSLYDPPPWLPQIHRPEGLAAFLDSARLRGARRMLLDRGCRTIVLYLWRPGFAPALDRVPHDRSVYHVADEYSFSETEQTNSPEEEALLRRVDRVFIHSPGLLEKKGGLNPRTEQIPNGVDFEAVAALRPEPADLAAIPHPRIGYCGWVKRQLDWELIDTLSARRPDDSFVFVGAVASHPELGRILERLDERPNVHFLGARSTEELLAYPAHFDACIMPYKMDDYTKYIYPLKLHEYLAGGAPIVSTPIRTVRDFGDVVELAETIEEWCGALDRALEPAAREPARVEARRAVARAHDWNGITHQVARAIADTVGGSIPERLAALPVPEDWRLGRFRRAEWRDDGTGG